MDISNETNLEALYALAGKQFLEREKANNIVNQCNSNINAINSRILDVERLNAEATEDDPAED